jgi:hypothetical protein
VISCFHASLPSQLNAILVRRTPDPRQGFTLALVDCPECSNPISSEAHACPRCGYPTDRQRKAASDIRRTLFIFVAIIFALTLVFNFVTVPWARSVASDASAHPR